MSRNISRKASKSNISECILRIYHDLEDGTDKPTCRGAMETQIQKTDLWTQWEKERVGWTDRVAWKYILSLWKTESRWAFALCPSEPSPVLCDNLEGIMEWRWEGGSARRGHIYTCDWFMLMYGRKQHNSVKQLSSKNLKKKESIMRPEHWTSIDYVL